MNQSSTVKPLYPGAFPPPTPDEDDAPYPKAPLNLTLGFDLETWQIPLEELLPSKKVPDGVMTTRKFRQIVSSIREIGLIEPLSVIKPDPKVPGFLLLDGNLRVLALKELGQDTAPCLIAKDFETYTYNHRINRLSTVQEHYMLRRAIDKGVSKERLARAFSVNLSTINSRINLLHGICPKAVELLQDHQFTPDVTRHLRKMKAARQIEAVELMIAANTITSTHADALLKAIREIMIITTPHDQEQFIRTLSDGNQWGISLHYKVQPSPDGLAQAFILAEEFLAGSPAAMVLGDNIFFGHGLPELLQEADQTTAGASVFGYRVSDPERYGVVDFDANGTVKSIIEKPPVPPSNYAVTGLYFVDATAPERARAVRPSARGELEITTLLESYLQDGQLNVQKMGRGYAWLDTGTHASLLDAGNFVRTLTERQGQQVGSPDEVAFEMGWIDAARLKARALKFGKNDYGDYLAQLSRTVR